MANNYKFTGVALATTSETTLLTAAADSTVVIRSIRVTIILLIHQQFH